MPACEPQGCQFDSQSGHTPGLLVRSPVGGAQEANTNWCFLLPSFPSLKINKYFKNNKVHIPELYLLGPYNSNDSDTQSKLWISCSLGFVCCYSHLCTQLPWLHCRHFYYTTILHPVPICVFPPYQAFPWIQLGVLQLNQFSRYLSGDSIIFHRLSTQFHKMALTSDASHKIRLSLVLLTVWL